MKIKSKKENIIVSIIVFSLLMLAIYFCYEDSKIKEVIIMLTSFGAAIAVFIQIKGARELATGEFVLSLQAEYSANEKHTELFVKCWRELKEDREAKFNDEDDVNILDYLTFFESMYIMVNNNTLSMKMLDELFGRRFFMVVNSIKIQEKDLGKNYLYYLNVYRLHAIWKTYRIRNGNEIFDDDRNFSEESKNDSNVYLKDLQLTLKEKVGKDCIYSDIYKYCPTNKKEWDEQWSFWKKIKNRLFYE